MGFDLLEQLNQQATKTRALLFHPNTRALIRRGDVHLMRAQWCAYLPTTDVPSFLQTVGLMYDHAIAEGKGIVRVARHLGLSFKYYPEAADACDTTGVMLIKSHGKKPLFSLVFYDKRQRVADMKQGKSLSAEETATIRDNVRFDITLHSAGIVALVGEARRRLQKLIAVRRCFGRAWRERFLAGDPKPSLWFLERAVFILSFRVLNGKLTRRSFSAWLVPRMINNVLRLDVLGSFERVNLHRLATLDDPVAAAWRADRANEPRGWAKRLAKAAGCSLPTVYQRRDAWLKEFGIDITVPFAAYRDLLFFGSHSVMPPDQRWAFLSAGQTNWPVDIRNIFAEAAQDFERRRREIVGRAINRHPLAMEIKLASEPASAQAPPSSGAAIGLLAPSHRLVASSSLLQRSRSISGLGPANPDFSNRAHRVCEFSEKDPKNLTLKSANSSVSRHGLAGGTGLPTRVERIAGVDLSASLLSRPGWGHPRARVDRLVDASSARGGRPKESFRPNTAPTRRGTSLTVLNAVSPTQETRWLAGPINSWPRVG